MLIMKHGMGMGAANQLPGDIMLVNVRYGFIIRRLTTLRSLTKVARLVVAERQFNAVHPSLVHQATYCIIPKAVFRAVTVLQPQQLPTHVIMPAFYPAEPVCHTHRLAQRVILPAYLAVLRIAPRL